MLRNAMSFCKKLLQFKLFLFLKKKLPIAYLLFANFFILSGCGNYFINSEKVNEGIGLFCILFGFILNFLYWKRTKNFNLILRASLYIIFFFLFITNLLVIFFDLFVNDRIIGLWIFGLILTFILILVIFLINKYTIIFKDKSNK
tara:strand:- start:495 stop:929 length:435 start_codon:yes stop_codon:yes gene_type:complete